MSIPRTDSSTSARDGSQRLWSGFLDLNEKSTIGSCVPIQLCENIWTVPLVYSSLGIEELKEYAPPLLMVRQIIGGLVHAAGLHITQERNRTKKLFLGNLIRIVPSLISSILLGTVFANADNGTDDNAIWLKGVFDHLNSRYLTSDELGIGAGLLLTGLKKALEAISSQQGRNYDRINLCLRVVFGGLSGIPSSGGSAFSAALHLIERLVERRAEAREQALEKTWRLMWMTVQDRVDEMNQHRPSAHLINSRQYGSGINEVLNYDAPSL